MIRAALACALLCLAGTSLAAPPATAPPQLGSQRILVARDTPLRLMVLNEVSSRTAKPGDRFVLRVDQAVIANGVTIVPVGAKAWGEVVAAQGSKSAGKAGELSARLLSVEAGGEQIAITGEARNAGASSAAVTTLAVLSLGPLAMLAPGNNARLKAGHIFTGYFKSDMEYDRATAKLSALPASATP
jgi:hypothetical protein